MSTPTPPSTPPQAQPSLPATPPSAAAVFPGIWQCLWSITRLPLQILTLGGAILLLFWLSTRFRVPGLDQLSAAVSGKNLAPTVAALIIWAVGLTFTVFLWWLVGRFFKLLSNGTLPKESLESLKDLPLGLPEGTIRSILALIVAVVGLPILLFSGVLKISHEVNGYINGIVTGVFGFYFGTRTAGASSKALGQIATAQNQAQQAKDERDNAQAEATQAKTLAANAQAQALGATRHAAAVTRATDFDTTLDELSRQASLASTVLDVIAPALPSGMLPPSVTQAVSTAQRALDAVRGVTKEAANDGQLQSIQKAVNTLTDAAGGSSALGTLLIKAAPMLSESDLSGLTPTSALATLLSVGARLGSVAYQRWHARVLAAPLASGLIEFGTVTPEDVHAALLNAPIFASEFAEEKERPGFDADLADTVLSDDAIDHLWTQYGGGTPGQAPLFQDRGELEKGLLQFQQVLLATRSAGDIPDDTLPNAIGASLANAVNPALRPSSTLNRDTVNQIIDAASRASAAETVPLDARAAFDALITLVGHARLNNVDLVQAIAEVGP